MFQKARGGPTSMHGKSLDLLTAVTSRDAIGWISRALHRWRGQMRHMSSIVPFRRWTVQSGKWLVFLLGLWPLGEDEVCNWRSKCQALNQYHPLAPADRLWWHNTSVCLSLQCLCVPLCTRRKTLAWLCCISHPHPHLFVLTRAPLHCLFPRVLQTLSVLSQINFPLHMAT